jgi:hypothetical protein
MLKKNELEEMVPRDFSNYDILDESPNKPNQLIEQIEEQIEE